MNNKEFDIKFIKDAVDSFRDVPYDDVEDLVLGLHQMGQDKIAMGISIDRERYDLFLQIKDLRLCSKQLAALPWTQN